MHVTLELPEHLVAQLEPQRDRVAEILARGLRHGWSGSSALRREVITFLARRPSAEEILGFRPSEASATRAQELLHRNQDAVLTPEEEAELDDICGMDRFVSLIKAEVLLQNPA